jgi:glycosyltransferase involved in cell wall biosynthesis
MLPASQDQGFSLPGITNTTVGFALLASPRLIMKICLISNTAWNLTHFRMKHILALLDMGIEIHAIAPPDGNEQKLADLGVKFHPWIIERRSLNPMKELVSIRRLQKIYNRIKPDLVHHYTVKAVLYGTAAARLCGIKAIVNSVTGLPYIIVSPKKGILKRLARRVAMRWYGWAVTGAQTATVLQNQDDLELLESFAPGVKANAIVTNGSGVDLDHYAEKPKRARFRRSPVNVLFVGRFLKEKGVFELMDAVRRMRSQQVPFEMHLCGDFDHGNRSSATFDDLMAWKEEGLVDWSGRLDDVRGKLNEADLVVLPSYREGTPRSLLEALAVGRPLVTTDVPGCRNVVDDNVNGLLVQSHDPIELADAMIKLIEDEKLREEMGHASRTLAEHRFDEREVIRQTVECYQELSDRMPAIDSWVDNTSRESNLPVEQAVYDAIIPIAG